MYTSTVRTAAHNADIALPATMQSAGSATTVRRDTPDLPTPLTGARSRGPQPRAARSWSAREAELASSQLAVKVTSATKRGRGR
jgi:hypothetical protein